MTVHTPALDVADTRRHQSVIWILAATFVTLTIWSHFALLDETVRGSGKIVPASSTQIVQSLEGGLLAEIAAREGEIVPAGAVLARLDDTRFEGAYTELQGQIAALQVRLARLEHELRHADALQLPESLSNSNPTLAASEHRLFQARKLEHDSAMQSFESAIALQQQEVTMLTRLAQDNLVPQLDLIKAEQQLSRQLADRATHLAHFTLSRSEDINTTLGELKQLEANLQTRHDQLKRTQLTAPVRSIVNKVHITTIGGVVAPGDPILELTPLDDELRIEARISPKDVAFISPGMSASVKLTAYDYTIYGAFPGTVIHISADTFEDAAQRDATPYYKVLIAVAPEDLVRKGKRVEIRPGMLAEAELNVAEKSVLQYLLKPLLKTTEAFSER